MSEVTRDQVLKTMKSVIGPAYDRIEGISIDQDTITVAFSMPADHNAEDKKLCNSIEGALLKLPGITQVKIIPTGQKTAPRPVLPGVKYVIAIASGKGGVGKSTVAAHLAVAMAEQGLKTGLLDADIYGPSVPRMMGCQDAKPEISADKYFIPLTAHGVALMSVGFLVPEDQAMIWRGPMVQKALFQMLRDTKWGALDILIVDMPPGTGDVQLTLAQKTNLSGAVIVSTPQDIALIDARKGIEMFNKVNVPVLGMIENMSTHSCTACGHEDHIFGHGGAREEAEKRGVAFLGALPLDISIRQNADAGKPDTKAFKEIAAALQAQLAEQHKKIA